MLARDVGAARRSPGTHRGAAGRACRSPDGRIPDRTLVMSGTPDGTIFPASHSGSASGASRAWLVGGWGRPLPEHVIEAYIRDARAAGIYLQPGDRVTIHVDRLGRHREQMVP